MPKRLTEFGLVYIGDFIYLIGGLTDGSSPKKDPVSSQRLSSRALIVSTDIFKIKVLLYLAVSQIIQETVMSIYWNKLANVQVVINCPYSVAPMCT